MSAVNGNDIVTDWNTTDRITVAAGTATVIGDLTQNVTGGNLVITVPGITGQITLRGITTALGAENFVF